MNDRYYRRRISISRMYPVRFPDRHRGSGWRRSFLAVMDAISNRDFLRSAKPPPSASKWEELPWLKAKGYYNLTAFVANKLELSLGLSWLHSHGKKRSSRMNSTANSHEVHKIGRDLVGIASNVFWRKKACVDWWSKVDGGPELKPLSLPLQRSPNLRKRKGVLKIWSNLDIGLP